MASQRDGQQSFTSWQFEELFAASPRAKEIFSSFYGKRNNRPSEAEESYSKQCDDFDNPLSNLKGSLVNKSKSRYNTDEGSEGDELPCNETYNNFAETLNEKKAYSSAEELLPLNNLQEDTSSPSENDICFDNNQADEAKDAMDSFNSQVVIVLKKLEEVEKRLTKEKEQSLEGSKKQKSHVLCDWSLRTVETDGEKQIIVEGHRSGDSEKQNWRSTVICERVSSRHVKTKSGSSYCLSGNIDKELMEEKGFPSWIIKAFKHGFPHDWNKLLQKYFKGVQSQSTNNKSHVTDGTPTIPGTAKEKKNVGNNTQPDKKKKGDTKDVRQRKKGNDGSEKKVKASTKKVKNEMVKTSKTTIHGRQTKNSQKADLKTPPESDFPKEQEVKVSRSGRIIAPPLEYWRGQRMIANTLNDSISIVKCHLEEDSVQLYHNSLLKPTTPLSRKNSNMQNSQNKKETVKGIRPKDANQHSTNEGTTSTDNATSDTGFTIKDSVTSTVTSDSDFTAPVTVASDTEFTSTVTSETELTMDSAQSDSVSDSTVIKQLNYTTSDSATNESTVGRKTKKGSKVWKGRMSGNNKLLIEDGVSDSRAKVEDLEQKKRGDGVGVDVNDNCVMLSSENETQVMSYRSKLRCCSNKSGTNDDITRSVSNANTRIVSKTAGKTFDTQCKRTRVTRNAKSANSEDFESSDAENKDIVRYLRNRTVARGTDRHDSRITNKEIGEVRDNEKRQTTSNCVDIIKVEPSDNDRQTEMLHRLRSKGDTDSSTKNSSQDTTVVLRTRGRASKQTRNSESSDAEAVGAVVRETRKRVTRNTSQNQVVSSGTQRKPITNFKRQKVVEDQTNDEATESSGDECRAANHVSTYAGDNRTISGKNANHDILLNRISRAVEKPSEAGMSLGVEENPVDKERQSGPCRRSQRGKFPVNYPKVKTDCTRIKDQGSIVQASSKVKEQMSNSCGAVPSDVKSEKPKKSSKPKSRKTQNIGKKVVIRQPAHQTDGEMWTAEEHERWTQALNQIPMTTSMFWQKVALIVKTRNAQECHLHYQSGKLYKIPKKRLPRAVQGKVVPTKLTAKQGTLARKRQLRDILDHHDVGYEDDIFDTTPYRNKASAKFSPVSLDEVEILSEEEDTNDQLGYKTPMNRHRPAGPLSASGTSEYDYISPGQLLQGVNRNNVDRYVHQMKKRKIGRNVKQAKSRTPVAKKTTTPHPLPLDAGDFFNVREAPPSETEDDDYYWSDA